MAGEAPRSGSYSGDSPGTGKIVALSVVGTWVRHVLDAVRLTPVTGLGPCIDYAEVLRVAPSPSPCRDGPGSGLG